MPIFRIVADSHPTETQVEQVKALGSNVMGYVYPHFIWVETSDGLTQPDVMVVHVFMEEKDFTRPEFLECCTVIAKYLMTVTKKSVEVVRPINGGIESVCWCTTEAGAETYGGGNV